MFLDDQAGWADAAGSFDSIDFVLGSIQTLDDQYADLGVFFTGGDDFAKPAGAYTDGWGAYTNTLSPPRIEIEFDIPRFAFAAQYPGPQGFWLFSRGEIIFQGTYLGGPSSSFLGVVTDVPIDEVWLVSGIGPPAIDNIFVGHAVPGPAAFALLPTMLLVRRRRR